MNTGASTDNIRGCLARTWEWRKPQPAAASKDWHVKLMEQM